MASVWEGRWCRLCKMSEWQSVKPPGKPSRPRHETHFWIEKVWSVTHLSGFCFILNQMTVWPSQATDEVQVSEGHPQLLKKPVTITVHRKTVCSTTYVDPSKSFIYMNARKNTAVSRPVRQPPRVSQVDLHDLRLQGRPRVRVDDELRRDFALIDFLCFVMVITSQGLGCVMWK